MVWVVYEWFLWWVSGLRVYELFELYTSGLGGIRVAWVVYEWFLWWACGLWGIKVVCRVYDWLGSI